MANYLTYPFKTMKITQSYLGRTSHYPHTTGYPKDYPIDEGGADTGRDWFYCPCDEIKIVRIYGVGSRGTNTMWIQSTTKVNFADGTSDYFSAQLTHMNDSDLNRLRVGQTFKRGQAVCQEGIDGATGNHIHMSIGKGTITNGGWVQNSNGKWVLSTTNGAIKPENGFYIDKNFTKVLSNAGITFKYLNAASQTTTSAKASTSAYKTGTYKVNTDALNVRKGPGTNYDTLKFSQFTTNAQAQIKKLNNNKSSNYFLKGMQVSITKISGEWGQCPSGWINLKYCKKV